MEGEADDEEPKPLPQCPYCKSLINQAVMCVSRKQSTGCCRYIERRAKFSIIK